MRMVAEKENYALLRADSLVTRRDSIGFDVTLTAGNRFGVLGASGSGKTTFLRTLAALKAPIDGRLFWNEVDVTRKSRWLLGKRRFLRKRSFFVALLFTNPYTSLEPWVPVQQFLGKSTRTPEVQAELLQKHCVPAIAATSQVQALSGFGRINLALMYALQNNPRVVLVDDVFRMVVPEVWEQLFAEFDAQVGETRGLIVASRFWQVLAHTNYVFVLDKGGIVEWGPRTSVFEKPQHPYTQQLLEQDVYSRSAVVRAGLSKFSGNYALEPREVTPGHWVR